MVQKAMPKKPLTLVAALLAFGALFNGWATPLASAEQPATPGVPCHAFAGNDNYFFDDTYEAHDYDSGYLAIHFKLKTPYNDGRQWAGAGIYMYAADCTSEYYPLAAPQFMSIDAGVQKYSVRFSSPTHYDFWNDETGLKETCADCSQDIPAAMASGLAPASVSFYGSIDGAASWIQSTSLPIAAPAAVKTPILIIPGLLGTELSLSNQTLWPNLALMAVSDDGFMDGLSMDASGQPVNQVSLGDVIGTIQYPFGSYDYSGSLIAALEKAGYQENVNLFVFPYDWRRDPGEIESALQAEMDHIAAVTSGGASAAPPKLMVIAHSYGGLVLKRYIRDTGDLRIGTVVFVGVPHLGAPSAGKALIFGDDLDIPILSSAEILKLAANMPSIYDLLPSADYYNHNPGFFDDLSAVKSPVVSGYASMKSMLTDLGKNLRLLNQAELSHTEDLDAMDFSKLPYAMYNIVGCGTFTLKTINKMYDGTPTLLQRAVAGPKYRIEGDSGDGTVPLGSAQFAGGTILFAPKVQHAHMLADPNIQAAIQSIAGGTAPTSLHATADSSCSLSGKLLSFSSNVNVTITDQTTGKILQPRIDYGIMTTGDDQHIFLPQADLATYEVNVVNAVAGNTLENVSVHNVNTTANPSTTYNYNGLNVGTANLKIAFPNDAAAGQTVSTIDPNTGESSSVPPSQELDGSYNPIPGVGSDGTATDTPPPVQQQIPAVVSPAPVETPPAATVPDDSGQTIPAAPSDTQTDTQTASDAPSTDDAPSPDGSGQSVQPITVSSDADRAQPITITVNIPDRASEQPVPAPAPIAAAQPVQQPQYVQNLNLDNGPLGLLALARWLLHLLLV